MFGCLLAGLFACVCLFVWKLHASALSCLLSFKQLLVLYQSSAKSQYVSSTMFARTHFRFLTLPVCLADYLNVGLLVFLFYGFMFDGLIVCLFVELCVCVH